MMYDDYWDDDFNWVEWAILLTAFVAVPAAVVGSIMKLVSGRK